jgi:DNA modification methylase
MELPVNKIICGDWIEIARTLPDKSVHVIITSPPYWGQRNYGVAGQLGLEKNPDEHIAKLVEGFREYRRVLRDDGMLWVNYGDKYAGGGNNRGNNNPISSKQASNKGAIGQCAEYNRNADEGIDQGNLLCLAWRLGLAMQADGWILRSDTIWAKAVSFCDEYSGSTMPESINGWRWERHRVKKWKLAGGDPNLRRDKQSGRNFGTPEVVDCPGCEKCNPNGGLVLRKGSWRPTRAHEYVLQFAKTSQYYCDMEAVREKNSNNTHEKGNKLSLPIESAGVGHKEFCAYTPEKNNPSGRNLRDVWVINPQPFKGAHYATFPEALVEPMIKVSTSQKGVCPKCGSQWARIVYHQNAIIILSERAKEKGAIGLATQVQGNQVEPSHNTTLGWKATCQCGIEEVVPAVVLDPFCGSGRTCAVAAKLGRNYIGVELNEKYIKDFAIPQTQEAETGVTIEEARQGQKGLFETINDK